MLGADSTASSSPRSSRAKHPKPIACRCAKDAGGERLQIVCVRRTRVRAEGAARAHRRASVNWMIRRQPVESAGMLCSAKELGLDADASGLLELAADAPVGEPLARHLGLPDTVYDLGLTPNRADCLSVEGVARDLAAALGVAARPLSVAAVPATIDRAIAIGLHSPVDVRATAAVSSRSHPTRRRPMRERPAQRPAPDQPAGRRDQLRHARTRQPLHAFDADTLQDRSACAAAA